MQPGRQADCFSSLSTCVSPLFDSSGITPVWLSYKSVDFDWIEIYIISSWEFWKLITYFPKNVIACFISTAEKIWICYCILQHLMFFLFTFKSRNKSCIYNHYLAMVKKERKSGSSSLCYISLEDERNINQAIWQDLPTLYSARKMQVLVCVANAVAQLWQAVVIVQDS